MSDALHMSKRSNLSDLRGQKGDDLFNTVVMTTGTLSEETSEIRMVDYVEAIRKRLYHINREICRMLVINMFVIMSDKIVVYY